MHRSIQIERKKLSISRKVCQIDTPVQPRTRLLRSDGSTAHQVPMNLCLTTLFDCPLLTAQVTLELCHKREANTSVPGAPGPGLELRADSFISAKRCRACLVVNCRQMARLTLDAKLQELNLTHNSRIVVAEVLALQHCLPLTTVPEWHSMAMTAGISGRSWDALSMPSTVQYSN